MLEYARVCWSDAGAILHDASWCYMHRHAVITQSWRSRKSPWNLSNWQTPTNRGLKSRESSSVECSKFRGCNWQECDRVRMREGERKWENEEGETKRSVKRNEKKRSEEKGERKRESALLWLIAGDSQICLVVLVGYDGERLENSVVHMEDGEADCAIVG